MRGLWPGAVHRAGSMSTVTRGPWWEARSLLGMLRGRSASKGTAGEEGVAQGAVLTHRAFPMSCREWVISFGAKGSHPRARGKQMT